MGKAIKEYLESIQLDCLKTRYKERYKEEIVKLQNQKLPNKEFLQKFKSSQGLTDEDINEIQKHAEKHINNLTVINTEYSSISNNIIFDSLFTKIHKTAHKTGFKLSEIPFAGTANSGEYNAFACKHPITDEKLIIIEEELIILLNLFSKIIASCIPLKDFGNKVGFNFREEELQKHLDNNSSIIERFTELVYFAIYRGIPSNSPQYFPDKKHLRIHHEILNSMELFVTGHEYGHIIAGHLKNNLKTHIIHDKEIEIIETNWNEEYEADELGLVLMLNCLSDSNIEPWCYMGAELFFTLLDLEDRISSFINSADEKRSLGSKTHPSPLNRKNRIKKALKGSLNEEGLETYLILNEYIENLTELLWNKLKTMLIDSANNILHK